MEIILKFFAPYYYIALTGAYSLLQNLQGLGVVTIWEGPYIDIKQPITVLSGFYFIVLIFILIFSVISSVVLSRRLSLVLILVLLSPGVLSLVGYEVISPIVPDKYNVGAGWLGEPAGSLINALTISIFSWALTTFLLHIFRLGKKTKYAFDHLWYAFGLMGVVFFVSDTDIGAQRSEKNEATATLQKSLSILDHQITDINMYCGNRPFLIEYSDICDWVDKHAKSYVTSLLLENDVTRSFSEGPTLATLLSYPNAKITPEALRERISGLNRTLCGEGAPAKICSEVPTELNQHPGLLTNDVSISTKYVMALEALAPTIRREWVQAVKSYKKLKEVEASPHRRWLVYMLASLLIGIKVANSSRELFSPTEESVYRKYSCKIYRGVSDLVMHLLFFSQKIIEKLWVMGPRFIRVGKQIFKK